MIGFPHAKINLGLSVKYRRPDGYHELESVFYPLPLRDALEIVPAQKTSLISTGIKLDGHPDDNLVTRAYRLIKNEFPQIPELEIHLHKAIPSGAGLGGGSADAACMLGLLNDFFGLGISAEGLTAKALQLGSDCPFFLQPSACYVRGRGDILEPLPGFSLSAYSFLLVHPAVALSTAWAYSQIQPASPACDCRALMAEPMVSWRDRLKNDFEPAVFSRFPELAGIKAALYTAGARYAAMTGSGSTIYGIFEKGGIPPGGISTPAAQTFLP